MRLNRPPIADPSLQTHEGAPTHRLPVEAQLRRTVMSCLLWEKTFYEDGVSVVERIRGLVPQLSGKIVSALAVEARTKMHLRHVPLLLMRELARHPQAPERSWVKWGLSAVIQRADELAEFMAIYWQEGRCPLSAQVKKGLAQAFTKFSAYELAKYNRDHTVRLRDVLFLVHAKPKNEDQAATFRQLANNELPSPDTWEVALSAGADKKETFLRLMAESKLGGLAFLRNLRNMAEAGVPKADVAAYAKTVSLDRILPFRFVAAARAIPAWEDLIEDMMLRALADAPKLPGRTVLVVDNSGSMEEALSSKSELQRRDAACGLAVLLREICEDVTIIGFGTEAITIPPRRGFALVDAIQSGPGGGTNTRKAVLLANEQRYDRAIVITDEQSHTVVPNPLSGAAYFINVGTYKNGIGYGAWTHIDGWSESVLSYIREAEKEPV